MNCIALVFSLVLASWVQVDAYESFQNMTINIPTKVNQIGPWFGLDAGGNITITEINSTDGSWPRQSPPTWSNLYIVLFSREQWVLFTEIYLSARFFFRLTSVSVLDLIGFNTARI
jgi:hypothetical protein